MEKKTNKAKLEILNFWENLTKKKLGIYGNSIIIHLQGECRIHICNENSAKS